MYRLVLAIVLSLTLAAPLVGQSAFADGGDFALDFVASAPFTYDHSTGGGAYDDRTIGKTLDVVESLEGGDFACGEVVSFLTQIQVDAGASGAQTIELTYVWTADTTGQSGVALGQIQNVVINRGVIAGGVGEGPGGTMRATLKTEGAPLCFSCRTSALPCSARVRSAARRSKSPI
jgi:hypothetical protein